MQCSPQLNSLTLKHQLSSPDELIESSDDSDDEIDEQLLLSPLHKLYDRKQKVSISAEAFGEFNKKVAFQPPIFLKDFEEKE